MNTPIEKFSERQAKAQERMAAALESIRNQLLFGMTPQEVAALTVEAALLTNGLKLARQRLERAIASANQQPTKIP